jgi:hypothetical protein
MKTVILSLEDHDIYIPDGYSLDDAATYMALLFSWAYENKYLVSSFYEDDDCNKKIMGMKLKQVPIFEFVNEILLGNLNLEDFKPKQREFVEDYVEAGIFYKDVCSFFRINNIFELSKDWDKISLFVQEIDIHYEDVKVNYH